MVFVWEMLWERLILARLPMKMAVGTSLLIIAIKSLIGFLGDVGNPQIGGGAGIDFSIRTYCCTDMKSGGRGGT